MSSDAPKPINPWAAAQANTQQAKETASYQQRLNRQALNANRPDQITPFGKTTWYQPSFDADKWKSEHPLTGLKDTTGLQGKTLREATKFNNQLQQKYNKQFASAQKEWDNNKDNWAQKTEFTPELQAIFDKNNQLNKSLTDAASGLIPQVQDSLSKSIDTSQLQPWQAAPTLGALKDAPTLDENYRNKIEQSLYSRGAARLDPRFQNEQAQLSASLANQGLSPGTAAWQQAMDQFGRTKNDAYSSLTNDSITGGNLASLQQFGAQLQGVQNDNNNVFKQFDAGIQGANANNQLRTNQLEQLFTLRDRPLQELQSILGGSKIGMPQFSGFSQMGSNQFQQGPSLSDLMQNNYNGQLANANASNANDAQAAALGLGATAAALGSTTLGSAAGGAAGATLGSVILAAL